MIKSYIVVCHDHDKIIHSSPSRSITIKLQYFVIFVNIFVVKNKAIFVNIFVHFVVVKNRSFVKIAKKEKTIIIGFMSLYLYCLNCKCSKFKSR